MKVGKWVNIANMNNAKTNAMYVENTPTNVNNVVIELVVSYIYMGQHYNLKNNNQAKEI